MPADPPPGIGPLVAAPGAPPPVELRRTVEADLNQLLMEEAEPPTRRWLGAISADWHRDHMQHRATEHLTIHLAGVAVGFVVLAGLGDLHGNVELRRIITYRSVRGRGVGRAGLDAAVSRCFKDHSAHRVWLDVKSANHVARRLYESAGLVVEGEFREAMAEPGGGYSNLVVMATLQHEWQSRDSS